VEPGAAARQLDFGDGARVTVGSGGKLEVLERSPRSVTLALRRGLSQFDIRPGGARQWRIESAGVTVEVVGTQFSLERTASTLRVEVQRGRVLVRGAQVPGQIQALDAGGVLTVPTTSDGPSGSPPGIESAALGEKPQASPLVTSRVRPATPGVDAAAAEPSWRAAATAQDWGRAWRDLGADGLAQQSQRSDDLADLFTLADVARLSGHPEAAVAPLRKIVERHASDPRAGVAAFTLGRVWLDALDQPSQAVSAFESALTLKLPATLAEDARARLVEALARSGDLSRARDAAAVYRSQHAHGARRADVDQWSPPQ
jgi:transmembrane sensor